MNTTYNPLLVALSILVATLASYTALDTAGRVAIATGRARLAWLIGGSLAMGTGIWSMHFIAMLAFHLPMQITYDLWFVLLSWVCAVVASLLALYVVGRPTMGLGSLLVGGLLMGPAIAGMHYVGMAAIEVRASVTYDPLLWTLSVVVAIVVSWVALWLAFRFRRDDSRRGVWLKRLSAAVMGLAIVGMHYTGMAAVRFAAGGAAPLFDAADVIPTGGLAAVVVIGSLVILGVALLAAMVDRRIQVQFVAPLRESEGRYQSVVKALDAGIMLQDVDGKILECNPSAERILGVPADALTGRTLLEFGWDIVREDGSPFPSEERPTSTTMRTGRSVSNVVVGMKRTDGVTWLSVNAQPVLRDGDTAQHGVVTSITDISDQIDVRETLRQAAATSASTAAATTAFLANMSHEIRTPMNGILGMVELLRDTGLTPEQVRFVETIGSSGDALLTIINDVLDVSKIDAGFLALEEIGFDLPAIVDATVRPLAARAYEQGVELACDVRPNVPHRVRGDPGRLRQVITNLVGNAIKFTHEGEVVLSLRLLRQTDGVATIEFAVRDTGIGVTAEQIGRIFEPFGQADVSTTRKYGGTGLGLSISRRLVGLMGGALTVTSELGKGSTFRFEVTFPLEAETPDVRPVRLRKSLGGVRTLVVDDNPTNRRVIKEFLVHAGALPEEFNSTDEALVALRQAAAAGQPFRLVVSDVHMPGRDGFDLARELHDDPVFTDTRIMLLTSGGQRGDGERCRELGIAAYLLKPVSRVDLLETASTVMAEPTSAGLGGPSLVTRHSIQETHHSLAILLAEDNKTNQQVAGGMLRKRGHRVDIVDNGRQAVEAVRKKRYDVVLMDIHMPELDGFGATREIRQQLDGTPLPIIAVTANVMSGERERCLSQGMDGYLAKPFRAHELFAAIEGWNETAADAPVPPEKDPSPAVDLDGFRSAMRAGDIEEMMEAVLGTFRAEASGRMANLESAVGARDAAAIFEAAHAFKSAAGSIHANALTEALAATEAAGRSHNLDATVGLLERVRQAHNSAASYLDSHAPGTPL